MEGVGQGVSQRFSQNVRRRGTERRVGARAVPRVLIAMFLSLASVPGVSGPAGAQSPAASDDRISLIPAPRSLVRSPGRWQLASPTVVNAEAPLRGVTERQLAGLRHATGLPLPMVAGEEPPADDATTTTSAKNPAVRVEVDGALDPEGYRIDSTGEDLVVRASSPAGAFYAFQTLRQLLPPAVEAGTPSPGTERPESWSLPRVVIDDAPRFSYRGLHLDVARHFFDVDFVQSMIDTMARFKLNRFHWHLTEDQGWRIEIDAYPKLTEIGAWRDETQVGRSRDERDGEPHGGFYTKEEIREVVDYAADRFVTVMPEIEMPGHATAALASYPELGCVEEALEVSTVFGVHDNVFCPGEETFRFLETVLDEVLELFPSELIHIGADEVRKTQWRESDLAQAVMEREGLESEDALQAFFVNRIAEHLESRRRRLVGWDEILEGELPQDAVVMTWRTERSAVEAVRRGHDVIRTPIQHSYFDFSQADPEEEPLANNWAGFPLPLERVYAFEPVPEELEPEGARHVLGGQANLWTEFVSTEEHAEYMLYPRALAMAEVLWTARERRDWGSFVERLPTILRRLELLGVDFRWPREELGARDR